MVSNFSISQCDAPFESTFSEFVVPAWPSPNASFVLHPGRFRLSLEMDDYGSDETAMYVSARLLVDPICMSLRTSHVPLALGLHKTVSSVLEEVDSLAAPHTGNNVWFDLIPVFAQEMLNKMGSALAACTWELDVQISSVRVGVVHCSSDIELVVAMIEDVAVEILVCPLKDVAPSCVPSLAVGTNAQTPHGATPFSRFQSLGADTPFSGTIGSLMRIVNCTSFEISGEVRSVSIDVISMDTAKLAPFLEPVHIILLQGSHAQPWSCIVSWMNMNLSSLFAETLACLAAGIHETDMVDRVYNRRHRRDIEQVLERDAVLGLPMLGPACALGEAQPELRKVARSRTISARQPQVRFRNSLGQRVQVFLRHLQKEESMRDGSTLTISLPWYTPLGGEEHRYLEAELVLDLAGSASTRLLLAPMPKVQAIPVRPAAAAEAAKAAESAESLASLSSVQRFRMQSTWSFENPEICEALPHDSCWMLVRREVTGMLHELDITLSSAIFLENRSSVSVTVGPLEYADEWMELPPGCEPQPVPLAWCVGRSAPPPVLWCGLTSETHLSIAGEETSAWAHRLKARGLIQPLLGRRSWRSMCRYRSMVASDYFLRSREISLRNRKGEATADLCATVYGVSADLHAPLHALFFSVAIEPMFQVCNRLCCDLRLGAGECPLPAGEDKELLRPSEPLWLEIEAPTGPLGLLEPVWPTRLRKERNQRRLAFRSERVGGVQSSEAHEPHAAGSHMSACTAISSPALLVTLATEPGLALPSQWAPLQVHQYSPRARRLIAFTQYWVVNRRSDCRISVPRQLHAAGTARLTERDRHGCFNRIECNAMRMLSEDLVHKGRIQIALHDQYYNANEEALVPVTNAFRVDAPGHGAAIAPRSGTNPIQRCFSYAVKPAPFPFYRTSIIEAMRRYTFLNHKQHDIMLKELGLPASTQCLPAGADLAFDPQSEELQLAITGLQPRPFQRLDAGAEGGFSAFFALDGDENNNHVQLLHQVDASEAGESTILVRPEPLQGPAEPATGRVWCLTALNTVVNRSSVVVRFADPSRPNFRIVNRSGYHIELCQNSEGAPSLHLPPEKQMSYSWFQPTGRKQLKVCVGNDEQCYDIGLIQQHHPRLTMQHSATIGTARHTWREEFQVRTRVHRGSREVHIHPWCRVINHKLDALVVRSAGKGSREVLIPAGGGSVCLHPEHGKSELSLEVRSSSGSDIPRWSRPIQLARALAGSRGYLRHLKDENMDKTEVFDITTVEVHWDTVSEFLLVELKPYVESGCPYLLENTSSLECQVMQTGFEEENVRIALLPGERSPFVPLGLGGSQACRCHVEVSVNDPGSGPSMKSVVIDVEKPQRVACGRVHVEVFKERPRRIVIQDAEVVAEANRRRTRREKTATSSAVLVTRRLLGTGGYRVGLQSRSWLSWAPRPPEQIAVKSTPSLPLQRRAYGRSVRVNDQPTHEPMKVGGTAWAPGSQIASLLPLMSRSKLGMQPQIPWLMSPARMMPRSPFSVSNLGSMSSKSCGPSPSVIDRLRKGSGDVFWQRQDSSYRNQQRRTRGTQKGELQIEGIGITLVDGVALQEVAYLSAKKLELQWAKRHDSNRELNLIVAAVQLDTRENTGAKGSVMLQPWGGRFKQVKPHADQREAAARREQPFISLHARWRAMDPGAGTDSHLQVDWISLDVRSMEVRLDTVNCFCLAQWALDLAGRVAPVCHGFEEDQCSQSMLAGSEKGSASDPLVGEPQCPAPDDFVVATPVFIKRLWLRRVPIFLSVRFGGKRVSDCQGNEALQASDYVLRKLIPFDVSQARVILGSNQRPSSSAALRCCLPCRGVTVGNATLEDKFLPYGLKDLASGAAQDAGATVLRQIPRLLGAQRLIGSPLQLFAELSQSVQLVWVAMTTCDFWVFLGALLMGIAALFESLEGILTVLTKTYSRISLHGVPPGLRQEPSSALGAVMDLIWYGFPWHLRQAYRECRRQVNIFNSAHSLFVLIFCILRAVLYCANSVISACLLMMTKSLQAVHLFSRTCAWYMCPAYVAEFGAPAPCRVGSALFRLDSLAQFSHNATAALAKVREHGGTRHRDWRMRTLPGDEGTLLALQGVGFFLIRSDAFCWPTFQRGLRVTWTAKGAWEQVELRNSASNGGGGGSVIGAPHVSAGMLLVLRRQHGEACTTEVLKLRSTNAAVVAFGFIEECLAGWAQAAAPSQTPVERRNWPLYQKVCRESQERASG